jgi:chromosome segregation ATPase
MSGKGMRGFLEDLDILKPEVSTEAASGGVTSATAVTLPSGTVTPTVVQASVNANAEMVSKIRAAVTAATHAPRLTSFLSNLETAKAAFPGDEKNAINAALAFSKLTSADIRDELTKAVAAALLEAETKIKRDIGQQREQLATELDAEAETHRGTISSLNDQIKTLQSQLETAQKALTQIDSTRTQRTAVINSNEATGLASLAAVKAELTSISNLLP